MARLPDRQKVFGEYSNYLDLAGRTLWRIGWPLGRQPNVIFRSGKVPKSHLLALRGNHVKYPVECKLLEIVGETTHVLTCVQVVPKIS